MAGPFGGPMAGPGECQCCGGPASSCGSVCITVGGCNLKTLVGATVTLSGRSVTSIAVTNGGSGYTVPPNVIVNPTSGNGCTAVAVLVGGVVDHINVTTGGAYSATPGVSISAIGAGGGATATATLGAATTIGTGTTVGQVASITRTAAGSGYTSQPTVTIAGDGTGATATANITAPILSFSVGNAGSNYTTAPTATVSTLTGSGGTARVLLVGSTVATVAVALGGSYATASGIPSVTLTTPTGHTGSGATAARSMKVTAANIASGGTGYVVGDTLTISGGTAATTATLQVAAIGTGGAVSSVTILTAGSYTAFPATGTPVSGGTGTGATFNLTWAVATITVTNAGANYSTAPTVVFGGSGGATASASLAPTTIASVTRVAGGAYGSTPGVTLSGGGTGTGGVVTATLDTFSVASFTLTANGSGYTTATASVSGGGGSGATASVGVNNQTCIAIPTAGNYTLTVNDALGRFQAGTSVVALTCAAAQGRSIQLIPDSAYICISCAGVGPTLSGYPIKKTLHYTTPGGNSGSVTLSGTAWNVLETYNVPCCDLGGAVGSIQIGWIQATTPAAGGAFGCFGNSIPRHCSPTDCAPASDGAAVDPVMTVACFNAGTGVWTLPESGGAFTFVLSGVSVSGVFSGTFTWTE